jgi:hypothetical protein
MIRWLMNNELERTRFWLNLCYCSEIYLEGLRKSINNLRIASLLASICIRDLQ